MNTVSKELELPGAFMLGAGAVSSKTSGINGEVCVIERLQYKYTHKEIF